MRMLRLRAIWALALVAVLALAPTALAQYTYDVDRYHTYTSRGTWWPHATTSNNTTSTVSWRVSYSVRHCQEWSGAVRLIKEADGSYGVSSCNTSSHTASTRVAPFSSAALMTRNITNLDYYEVRKYDRSNGRLLERGYATSTVSYPEYAFSEHF